MQIYVYVYRYTYLCLYNVQIYPHVHYSTHINVLKGYFSLPNISTMYFVLDFIFSKTNTFSDDIRE